MIRVRSTASANLPGSLLNPGASRSITHGVNIKRHAEQHDLARQQQRENPVAEHPHRVGAAGDADARIGRNERGVERAFGEDRAEMVRQPQRHEKRVGKRVAKRLYSGGLLVTVAGKPKGLTSSGTTE